MSKDAGYVVCVYDEANPASLQKRKLYRVVDPEPTDPDDYVRILDEEGDDYL